MNDGFYGWIHNPAEVEKVLATLPQPLFAAAAPNLAGTGENKQTLLYLGVRKVIGKDERSGPQLIGDCVSWGWGGMIDYLQCGQILAGQPNEYEEIATESIYALSRVEIGHQNGSMEDGSVGAWAAKACSTMGVLSRTTLGPYDSKRAKAWGASGLPDNLEPEARKHLVQTTSLIQNFQQACDAIGNGYPVAVCSNQGFTMTRDAQGFCSPQGTWAHCMLFIATRFDRPGLLCAQSWGPATPNGPRDLDQPTNTFWVDATVANKMFAMHDSFTASPFNGFPAQRIADWNF